MPSRGRRVCSCVCALSLSSDVAGGGDRSKGPVWIVALLIALLKTILWREDRTIVTSIFGFPTSKSAILASFRPDPTKERLVRVEKAATVGSVRQSVKLAQFDVENPKMEVTEAPNCGLVPDSPYLSVTRWVSKRAIKRGVVKRGPLWTTRLDPSLDHASIVLSAELPKAHTNLPSHKIRAPGRPHRDRFDRQVSSAADLSSPSVEPTTAPIRASLHAFRALLL